MLTATIIAAVYVALIAMHVLAIRGGEPSGEVPSADRQMARRRR